MTDPQGQIILNSKRGELLKEIIHTYNPKKIVEIGTWKGLGSTKCILEIINDDCEFISIESNQVFYKIAEQNPRSPLADKVLKKNTKRVKTDQVLKKHKVFQQ